MIYRNITSLVALTCLLIITLGCGIVSVDVDSDKLESEISEKTSKAIKFKEGILGNSDNTTDTADEAHGGGHDGDGHDGDKALTPRIARTDRNADPNELLSKSGTGDKALPPHIAERAKLWIAEEDLTYKFMMCRWENLSIVKDLEHPLGSSQSIVDGKVYNPPTPTIEEAEMYGAWEPTITLTIWNITGITARPAGTIHYDVVGVEDGEVWDVFEEDLSIEIPVIENGDSYSEQLIWPGEEDEMRITSIC
jgi:hypothetical protein